MSYPKRILYVEDDADSREVMGIYLGLEGYETVTATTATEALELAEQNGFAAILLDNWLAQGSGVELCKQIRRIDPDTPIIFCSSSAYETDIQQGLAAGAQGYFSKPLNFQILVEAIGELTQAAPGQSA